MLISDVYALVKDDFAHADRLIHENLRSDVPLVETIGQYLVDSGGKRLRPLLVLLVSQALGRPGPEAVKLATVIEFLHTATLLHDDVVDTSTLRRGNATANARWGNAPSVLVGDFLYSRAFQMMVSLSSMEVLKVLADATNVIAEGEVLQLTNCRNPDLGEPAYLTVITAKTAKLFEAATLSAAHLADSSAVVARALGDFGLHLGIAFQLADDVLDYLGDAETMGKNVGDDLAEGKPTLPLIQAQKTLPPGERDTLRTAIRKGDTSMIETVVALIHKSGALDYTLNLARSHAEQARRVLADHLPDTPFRQGLIALTDIAVNRNH